MVRSIFSLRVVLAGFILATALFAGTLAILWITQPEAAPPQSVTAILNITPGPTATQVTPTAAATSTTTPTPLAAGELAIGVYTQVSGTGGEGLRLRAAAGLNEKILLLGSEGEIYLIKDGPRNADGYTWWLLVDPDDAARQGWAVTDYLSVVVNP